MKTTKELLRYYFRIYFKSTQFVMPFVMVMVFLYSMYSTAPIGVVESYSVSIVVVFLIMIWVSLAYNSLENQVSEQLLVLKVQSELKYYISKSLFLFILGFMVSLFMALFPVVQNAINGFRLYNREITGVDVVFSLLLHIFSAFTGGAVGAFFHQRIIKDRKLALVMNFGIAIIALAKGALNNQYDFLKFFTWVLPPIADVMKDLSGDVYFAPLLVIHSLILLGIYGLVLSVLQIHLLKRNKF